MMIGENEPFFVKNYTTASGLPNTLLVKSSGGSKLNELFFGVIPQVMPTITSYWLYRFEINLRASAVLGVVGAGGVGAELINQLRFRDFPRAGTVLVVTILMVLIVDTISAAIRRRIIKGREIKV
ncbi:MAG: hypothetical protein CL930_10395 [Deltaproteobacteria bacterium]|nr:hypothetical protein [Deltaproteobacteria bacterium]